MRNVILRLSAKRVLLYTIKDCKSTQSPVTRDAKVLHAKLFLRSTLSAKKILKDLAKLNLNNTEMNIYLLTYLVKYNSNQNLSFLKPRISFKTF